MTLREAQRNARMERVAKTVAAIEYSLKSPELRREWTFEQIKKGFNNGNGKRADLRKYAEDNKAFCRVEFL